MASYSLSFGRHDFDVAQLSDIEVFSFKISKATNHNVNQALDNDMVFGKNHLNF